MNEKRASIRAWPAVLILVAAAGALIFVWFLQESTQQTRNIRTATVLLWAVALLFLWMLFFSRVRWRLRFTICGAALLLLGIIPAAFEIRGVTGDLVPILEPRWKPRHTVVPNSPTEPIETNAWQKVAGEFPQFYGPNRNAALPTVAIETNWAARPPRLLWKKPVGQAWSGFAVRDGLAITQEQRGEEECVVAYELLTGRTVWLHSDPARYSTTIAGEGPRATPTILSNRVYTFGATGLLNCLDFVSGKRLWSKDARTENGAPLPDWGLPSSPLVVEGQVIISIGGDNNRSLVAYSATSGEFLWGAGDAKADYSSPILASLLGVEQIIIFNSFGLVAHNTSGQVLWSYKWPGGHPHITPPLIVGTNLVLASSGYGTGAELIRIERDTDGAWKAERVWKSLGIKSKFGPIFLVGDSVYGLDDGMLACIDVQTGQRQWKDGRYGHGQGLLLRNTLLLTSEKGDLALIQPDSEALIEVARLPVFSDKTWNPPALAGEYLLVRNHKEAACLQITLLQSLPTIAAN